MANPKPNVIVTGASSRAAAFSARRAGFRPLTCDLFADADLRAACRCVRIPRDHYPDRLPEYLEEHAPAPVLYTGALENYPEIVDRLSRRHPILGNPSAVLLSARSPRRLRRILEAQGLHSPDLRPGDSPPGCAEGWLVKPLRGSGGSRIRAARSGDGGSAVYFQLRVAGLPASGVFVASRRGTVLLGITRQLVGEAWLHAPPFAYCGSIGPLPVSETVRAQLTRAGAAAAAELGLRGLFGLDFILQEGGRQSDDRAWIVELNPRYTASVETLEEALGVRAFAMHVLACEGRTLPAAPSPAAGSVAGKAVLFAARELSVGLRWKADPRRAGDLADIPAYGERIPGGRPVITVFARGGSPDECLLALKRQARAAEELVISGKAAGGRRGGADWSLAGEPGPPEAGKD